MLRSALRLMDRLDTFGRKYTHRMEYEHEQLTIETATVIKELVLYAEAQYKKGLEDGINNAVSRNTDRRNQLAGLMQSQAQQLQQGINAANSHYNRAQQSGFGWLGIDQFPFD
jgi:hypothetical protein